MKEKLRNKIDCCGNKLNLVNINIIEAKIKIFVFYFS
jgi:hypothetical protein